jgi:hypothetical protein
MGSAGDDGAGISPNRAHPIEIKNRIQAHGIAVRR